MPDHTNDISDIGEFTDLENSRTIFLVGEIDSFLIKDVTEKLFTLVEKNPTKHIELVINTTGGTIDDTFMLYDLIKYLPTEIHTIGLGSIQSAGCLLLAAGAKGKRKMGKNARLMYHAGWISIEGTIFELQARLNEFNRMEKKYDELFASEIGASIEDVEALYDKLGPTKDRYLDSEQCKKLNIVDIIL